MASSLKQVASATPDFAYYYPAPYWGSSDSGWIKSLLLFFDGVSILLPDYMYGRHAASDPTLAEPLEDLGLLQILDPGDWVDQEVTEQLATAMVDLLAAGMFDDLERDDSLRYAELSYSRMGYGADVDLGEMLVDELLRQRLARPSQDGVSVPLHPVVRTTILVLLAQLARGAGARRDMKMHPATNHRPAVADLLSTFGRESLPSAGHVVTLDLEPVTLNLENVPLDELLDFRREHLDAHRAYVRHLHAFLAELSGTVDGSDRERLLAERQAELFESANALRGTARQAFTKAGAGLSIGIAGAVWAATTGDPVGLMLATTGIGVGALPTPIPPASAYSYMFDVTRQFG